MLDYETIQADLENHFGPLRCAMTLEENAAVDYLLAKFQSKIVPEDSREIDRLTFEKFYSAQTKSAAWVPPTNVVSGEILDIARGELHRAFDDVDCSLENILAGADLGPGANVRSHETCSYLLKVGLGVSGTGRALRLVRSGSALYDYQLGLSEKNIEVLGSNITFVPKTSRSSRLIATEPVANMLLQKGISGLLSDVLLKKFGISLEWQPDVNRRFAKIGSLDGSYCTIDLSSASDLLSKGLCKYLLPDKIWQWIEASRCEFTVYEDRVYEIHSVTTMGNGYCSSLQTLIFASICFAAGDNRPKVFGDDIIIPRHLFGRVVRALEDLGLEPNIEKTFSDELPSPFSGRFRETCGEDYLNGINIRPVFVKQLTEVSPIIVYNQLSQWFNRFGFPWITTWQPNRHPFKTKLGFISVVPRFFPEDSGFHFRMDVDCVKRPGIIRKSFQYITICDGPTCSKIEHVEVNGTWLRTAQSKVSMIRLQFDPLDSDTMIFSGKFAKDLGRLTPQQWLTGFLRGSVRENKIRYRSK